MTTTVAYYTTELSTAMGKLKLTGQNLCRVFNFECGCVRLYLAIALITKQLSLKLKTRAKQLLGSLPLPFVPPLQP
jgi:hypothetical protein